jgi:hypothetical protein
MDPDPGGKLNSGSATLATGNPYSKIKIDIQLSFDKEPVIVFFRTLYFCFSLSIVFCAWSSREMLESLLTELTTALRLQVHYFYILLVRVGRATRPYFMFINMQNRALRAPRPLQLR